jgi:hypothetical protein
VKVRPIQWRVRGRWKNEGSQVGSGVGSELGVWWLRKVQTSPEPGGRWGSERVVRCLVGGRWNLSVKSSYDAQSRRQKKTMTSTQETKRKIHVPDPDQPHVAS